MRIIERKLYERRAVFIDHSKLHQAIAAGVVLTGGIIHYYGIPLTPSVVGGGISAGTTALYFVFRKTIPKKVRYTIENLNLFIKRGDKKIYPLLRAKSEREYGYLLVYDLPFGMSEEDFENNQRAFEVATNSEVEITEESGRLYMKIMNQSLPKKVGFSWDLLFPSEKVEPDL